MRTPQPKERIILKTSRPSSERLASADLLAPESETELHLTMITLGLAQAYYMLAQKVIAEGLDESELDRAEHGALKFISMMKKEKSATKLDVHACATSASDTLRELFGYARTEWVRH